MRNPLALSSAAGAYRRARHRCFDTPLASLTATQHERVGRKIALILVVALALAACGRKGDLRPPPGDEDSPYPRAYPSATYR